MKRATEWSMFAAMAAMMDVASSRVYEVRGGRSVLHRPRLRVRAPEKYPGQRSAYLRGAWRPWSQAEIEAHNQRVEKAKAEARAESTEPAR